MMPNTFCKSIKIIPLKRPFSSPVVILSVRSPKQVFVEYFFRQPDFLETRLEPADNFVLTQKLLCLAMNNPFSNF